MDTTPEFIRRQYEFAAHIRDPANNPAPGDVEDRRMAIYRELFYNNVESLLCKTFPILRKLHDDTAWHTLVRDYFARHRARTPLFLEIPREFLNWLEHEYADAPGKWPFLPELAHYEWVELALSISEETLEQAGVDPVGDLLTGVPVLSPLAWQLVYRFPVHKIVPDCMPDTPGEQPTYLVAYRDATNETGFLEINAVTKRLLELVAENTDASGEALLLHIAGELSHPRPETVINGGADILKKLRGKDILLGTRSHQPAPPQG